MTGLYGRIEQHLGVISHAQNKIMLLQEIAESEMTKDKDMFNKLQQEQRDLDASYRQSLQNKKEHETRDQDQATGDKGKCR